AKARKAQQQTADTEPKADESAESDDPKKAAVAAAIARAKARKAQQQQTADIESEASEQPEAEDPKKAAVAAAIARAKARKAAAQADSSDSKENN
ncbi:electron transport complex subunit RsxC, partial [Vibrio breoganii]